jgi:predicted nucleotidyltransferase
MTTPPIDVSPEEWRIIRDILYKHVPDREVWAFGSRTRGTARRYSDLDLAILTDVPLSFDIGGAMKEDFSESDLPFRVDILDWAVTQENFRRIVERDKVVVQVASVVSSPNGSR